MDDVGEKQKKRRESEGRGDANAPKDQQTNEKAMVILVFCCCTWLATVAKCTRCIGVVLGSEPVFFPFRSRNVPYAICVYLVVPCAICVWLVCFIFYHPCSVIM